MYNKLYRFYSLSIKKQEAFLNRMSSEGWRLVKTKRLMYKFEPCTPNGYEYRVIFIGEKSYKKNKDYQSFFRNMGYDIFTKNANLNYSIGKMRWRPYGNGGGQIATSPGIYNKELLIVGKKYDGKPLEIFTTNADLADYYRLIRNVFCSLFFLVAFIFGLSLFFKSVNIAAMVIYCVLLAVFSVPIIKYAKLIRIYKELAKIEE